MANIALLGGGIECLPIIQRAIALGHQAIVIDANPDAPGMRLAPVPVVASCYHTEAVLPALGYALNHHGIKLDAVLCAGTDTPHVAAAVASAYKLPGLTPEAARLSVDKVDQFQVLASAGLPVVPDAVMTFYGTVTLPGVGTVPLDLNPYELEKIGDVVIKPADSRGGRGVQRLKLIPSETDEHDAIWEACAYARQFSKSGKLIGQRWLDGPQLSTESIVVDGRVLFTAVALRNYDRLAEYAPHIIEDGFDMPYGDAALRAEVDDLIERGCVALGWRTLTVKADLIVHQGKVVILELAARLSGGFLSTHGTAWAYHYPLVDVAIHLAVGEWPAYVVGQAQRLDSKLKPIPDFVCQRYIFPAPADIGRRVVSVPVVADLVLPSSGMFLAEPTGGEPPGRILRFLDCAHATYAVRPGDVIAKVVSHGQRLGQAIATGPTPEQARARAEQAVKDMKAAISLE